jgi:hypothetical protein
MVVKMSLISGKKCTLKAGMLGFHEWGVQIVVFWVDTMQSFRWVPVFSKNMLPPSSGSK